MGDELRKELMKTPGDFSYALEQVFLRVSYFSMSDHLFCKIDNELRLLDADNTGSTACVAVVRQEGGARVLYIANLGDTRAVISKNGLAERLSYDHRATDQAEIDRIVSGGGRVTNERVGGTLAITRAFGDHSLKKEGVIAKPYIRKHALRPADKCLVIASDGVWDSIGDQDAINLCSEDSSTKDIA